MVRKVLASVAPGVKAWAFGSRVNGTAKRFSDLDLALYAGSAIDLRTMAELRNAFEESDLPISVDLLDLASTSPAFRKLIEKECVEL
ncbi:MAG: nucleotidyltransferase domain-containing protein [Flavobacteriales bacterium]|nr:nucleotidyltransferase domain-containing protein [Flavobacteriales bacterium]